MNPKQLRLMVRPGEGTVHLVADKPGTRPVVVRNMTDDFVLMQAAEILREECEGIETVYRVTHSNGDVLELTITAQITLREHNPVR